MGAKRGWQVLGTVLGVVTLVLVYCAIWTASQANEDNFAQSAIATGIGAIVAWFLAMAIEPPEDDD